ncbi:MAG: Gfo/Idh/MocA family oxidoreductase [Calditerrivibrio sp.]|nr:Gfo/Idh/MocA family oxidoreductase [Calditerrivibrio sp.]
MSSLKVAIVGCGRIGFKHCQIISKGMIKGLELVGVCDINPLRAKEFGNSFNVPYFLDYFQMLSKIKCDIVSILTESGNHAKHTIDICKYVKNIVVEKPMCLTLDDADSIIEACDKHGCRLFVVKQNRFNLPVLKLKEAIDKGRFGKIFLATARVRWCRTQEYYDMDAWRGTWAMDGGVLANQASHHIDLLQWLAGDVESVFAKASTTSVNIETENTAIATIKFSSGALGVIEATTATRPKDLEGSISILGEKGSVVIGGFAVNKIEQWEFVEKITEDEEVFSKYSENPPDVYGFGHIKFYEHVVDCINNNKKQLIDGLEGRKNIELITALYESIETGKEVFLKFRPKRCKLGVKNGT